MGGVLCRKLLLSHFQLVLLNLSRTLLVRQQIGKESRDIIEHSTIGRIDRFPDKGTNVCATLYIFR